MPTSSKEGKKQTLAWVDRIPHTFNRVLDLGVGKGTYHKLFHKTNTKLSSSSWVGVEAWQPYIDKFNLTAMYDKIINQDIRSIDYKSIGPFDITFAGDVLEHVSKEEAVKIVDDVLSVCPYMIISIPIIHYPQDAYEGNHYEIHVKDDWSHREMMETFPQIKKNWCGEVVGCYLLSNKDI
jgi:predicted TPR repeat methyltransferase